MISESRIPVRIYEEERLLLYIQEAIAKAIDASGLTRTQIAERLDKNRSFVTQALSSGRNLTIASIAGLTWAAGFRLQPQLDSLVPQATTQAPSLISMPQANRANVIPFDRRVTGTDQNERQVEPAQLDSQKYIINGR
jgi:hypothetical protein